MFCQVLGAGWRNIATSCSSACFQNEQANFDKLRYAEPRVLLQSKSGGSDPSGQGKLKTDHTGLILIWLGIRDGNITFKDSLDFDISEINSVYDNNEGLAKTMRTY